MEVTFANNDLDRLEVDAGFTGGYSQAVIKAYRKRLQQIRSATDERTFYQLRSLRFEKLKGKQKHQHSMRLNDQYRLIMELQKSGQYNIVHLVSIEDYH